MWWSSQCGMFGLGYWRKLTFLYAKRPYTSSSCSYFPGASGCPSYRYPQFIETCSYLMGSGTDDAGRRCGTVWWHFCPFFIDETHLRKLSCKLKFCFYKLWFASETHPRKVPEKSCISVKYFKYFSQFPFHSPLAHVTACRVLEIYSPLMFSRAKFMGRKDLSTIQKVWSPSGARSGWFWYACVCGKTRPLHIPWPRGRFVWESVFFLQGNSCSLHMSTYLTCHCLAVEARHFWSKIKCTIVDRPLSTPFLNAKVIKHGSREGRQLNVCKHT